MAQACPECRTENADGAMFCRACGVPLQAHVAELPESDAVDSPRCDECGHHNPSAARFCERCGYELEPWVPEWAEDDGDTPPPVAKSEPSPPLPPPLPAAWSHAAVAGEDTFDPLSAPTLVMSHTAPTPLTQHEPSETIAVRRRPLRWVAAGLALLAAFAVMAWLAGPSGPPPAVDAAPAPAAAPASVAASASVSTQAVASAPASAPESARTEAPPAAAAMPASTPTQVFPPALVASAPAAMPAASTSAPAARKRLPEPVARKRAQEAPAQRTEPAPPVAAPAPPVATPAAPPPERAKTVAELCAGSNLLTRGFCEQRECRRAELSADPVCVKLKDAEQRRLFQQ